MSDAKWNVSNGSSRWLACATIALLFISSQCAANQGDPVGTGISSTDLTGDGVTELIECVPSWSSDAGAVDVFDGATGNLIVRFVGAASAQLGRSCATVPDINGDGLAELLIGAPGEQRAYLALGPFVDVEELQVVASRLNLILEPPDGLPHGF